MAKHAKTTFKFSCGGFFGGYWKLEIFESNNGYYATYSNSTYSEIADRILRFRRADGKAPSEAKRLRRQ